MPCPEGTKTYDYLAQELDKVGLTEMAARAREAYYHDFLSPLALPEMQLERDLHEAVSATLAAGDKERAFAIELLRQAHMQGEFDASKEESDEWAASSEGQEAFDMLIKGTE